MTAVIRTKFVGGCERRSAGRNSGADGSLVSSDGNNVSAFVIQIEL